VGWRDALLKTWVEFGRLKWRPGHADCAQFVAAYLARRTGTGRSEWIPDYGTRAGGLGLIGLGDVQTSEEELHAAWSRALDERLDRADDVRPGDIVLVNFAMPSGTAFAGPAVRATGGYQCAFTHDGIGRALGEALAAWRP